MSKKKGLELVIKQKFLQNFIKLSKFTSKNATVLSIRFFLGSVFHRLNDINKNYLLKPWESILIYFKSYIFLDTIMKLTYRWFQLVYYNNSKIRFFIVLSKTSFFNYYHKDKYAPHRFSTWNSTIISYHRSSTLQNKVMNWSIREASLIQRPVRSFSVYE